MPLSMPSWCEFAVQVPSPSSCSWLVVMILIIHQGRCSLPTQGSVSPGLHGMLLAFFSPPENTNTWQRSGSWLLSRSLLINGKQLQGLGRERKAAHRWMGQEASKRTCQLLFISSPAAKRNPSSAVEELAAFSKLLACLAGATYSTASYMPHK